MFCSRICYTARKIADSKHAEGLTYFFKDAKAPESSLFTFHPFFFSTREQRILLQSSLKKLDSVDPTLRARRRRARRSSPNTSAFTLNPNPESALESISDLFQPDEITSQGITPDVKTQTHILHLGAEGEIFPHVDNLEASGSWILGVSLGAPRTLRMEKVGDAEDSFEVLLPSGSVYIQRDAMRFEYKHSITKNKEFRGEVPTEGQRISIMIRDLKLG
ncbi:hypothetical protein DFH11DRAFT_1541595 [Phellopilus nigrolimitatus]|nr:hypothetical protein DFH11DRAFT_1541595 [Phellopilus nigrolimitatus]